MTPERFNEIRQFYPLMSVVERISAIKECLDEIERLRPDALAMGMINELRENGRTSVTICCDDPGTENAEDASTVDIWGEWTNWSYRRFSGKDVLTALQKARDAMHEATKGAT